jgi:hypothetical protein
VARAFLQSGHDVLLVSHRGDHDDAGFGVLADDALGGLDAFHLGHGDVHEHDVGTGALILGDGGAAVASLARDLSAEGLDHLGEVAPREDGVIDDQEAERLPIGFSD